MDWHIIELESTDSTNNEARRIAKNHTGQIAVRTEMQTAGRGQYGRQWISPSGKNLLATYSIPLAKVVAPSLVSLNIGAALQMLLCGYGIPVQCKWPNDLLVSGYKIAGILIEQDTERCYIGIGVNCNWPESRMKTPKGKCITGITAETGNKVDPDELSRDICKKLSTCISLAADEIIMRYREAWNDAGKPVKICNTTTWCDGTIRAINADGTLSVTTETNTEITIASSAHVTMDNE